MPHAPLPPTRKSARAPPSPRRGEGNKHRSLLDVLDGDTAGALSRAILASRPLRAPALFSQPTRYRSQSGMGQPFAVASNRKGPCAFTANGSSAQSNVGASDTWSE